VARAEQAAVQARDEELARAVQTAFATPAFTHITAVVQNGVVRLTGTVPTGAQRLEAAVVARAIPGVRAVQDDLRLATAPH
jgi:osmotically-inducible protein OsmY